MASRSFPCTFPRTVCGSRRFGANTGGQEKTGFARFLASARSTANSGEAVSGGHSLRHVIAHAPRALRSLNFQASLGVAALAPGRFAPESFGICRGFELSPCRPATSTSDLLFRPFMSAVLLWLFLPVATPDGQARQVPACDIAFLPLSRIEKSRSFRCAQGTAAAVAVTAILQIQTIVGAAGDMMAAGDQWLCAPV